MGVGVPSESISPLCHLAKLVWRHGILTNAHFITLSIVFVGLSGITSAIFGYPLDTRIYTALYFLLLFGFGGLFATTFVLGEALRHRSLKKTWTVCRAFLGSEMLRERALSSLPAILLIPVILSAFSSNKAGIPTIVPFYLDPALAALDRAFHGGTDPWRLLHDWLPPRGTFLLGIAYNMWVLVNYVFLFMVVFSPPSALRARILCAYFASWFVIGNLAATLLSSAGPCFYGRLYPDAADPFAGLMASLHQVNETYPLWALDTQDILWRFYTSEDLTVAAGISAMPSMHVASTFVLFLASLRFARWLRVATGVFVAVIMVGSVHLGWHYAIDGYVSLGMAWAIWWVAGRIIPDDAPEPFRQDEIHRDLGDPETALPGGRSPEE